MQEKRYRLIFNGQISFEYDTFEVKQNICTLFNTDPAVVDTYFTGVTVILKENLTRDEADRLKKVFDGTGGVAIIREMENHETEPAAQPPKPTVVEGGPFACPKCGAVQNRGDSCFNCGVIFDKLQKPGNQKPLEPQSNIAGIQQVFGEPLPEELSIDPRERDARQWASICYLSAFSGCIIPFGNIIGPFLIWFLKKDQSEFVRTHGKIALNFQIPVTILVILILIFRLLLHDNRILIPAGALVLYSMVMIGLAAMKAHKGEFVRIPLSRTILT